MCVLFFAVLCCFGSIVSSEHVSRRQLLATASATAISTAVASGDSSAAATSIAEASSSGDSEAISEATAEAIVILPTKDLITFLCVYRVKGMEKLSQTLLLLPWRKEGVAKQLQRRLLRA